MPFHSGIPVSSILFKNLFRLGPCTSDKFSVQVKMDQRYIREWLLSLAAAGYINYEKNPFTT